MVSLSDKVGHIRGAGMAVRAQPVVDREADPFRSCSRIQRLRDAGPGGADGVNAQGALFCDCDGAA